MVRMYDPGRDRRDPDRETWELNRPGVVDKPGDLASVVSFLRHLRVYPEAVMPITGPAWRTMATTRTCPAHPRRVWETVTVTFFELGSVTVGGVVDERDRGQTNYVTASVDPVAMTAAAGLAFDRPKWLPGISWDTECRFHCRRIEHVLSGLMATLYAWEPKHLGGRHPVLAEYVSRWAFAGGCAVQRNDGVDLSDPRTWE